MHCNIQQWNRIFSKIAFNTLAYSIGKCKIMEKYFGGIRNWIINGGVANYTFDIKEKCDDVFDNRLLTQQMHSIVIIKNKKCLYAIINLYGTAITRGVILSQTYEEPFWIDGLICDWRNRKEYKLNEYIDESRRFKIEID